MAHGGAFVGRYSTYVQYPSWCLNYPNGHLAPNPTPPTSLRLGTASDVGKTLIPRRHQNQADFTAPWRLKTWPTNRALHPARHLYVLPLHGSTAICAQISFHRAVVGSSWDARA